MAAPAKDEVQQAKQRAARQAQQQSNMQAQAKKAQAQQEQKQQMMEQRRVILKAILSPEASIFSDPISQSSCAADASATIAGELPIDSLSWCMGAQGSVFPLSGTSIQKSPIQSAALMTERLDYKMHDLGMVPDSVGENSPGICSQHYNVVMPKSRYRYQMVGNSSDTHSCYPFGRTVSDWEGGHDNVGEGDNFSFLIFRKRNCCFL